jgi:hypothetical protein
MVGSTGKNRSMILQDLQEQNQLLEEQTYQAKLRAAAVGSVGEADVAEVVAGIVQRAKSGDKVAIDQLFNQVLGANQRPTHVTNNLIVQDVETGARLAKRANGNRRLVDQ